MAKVLVVDDDPSLLRALRLGLAARGHEVITAVNGEQGMSQAALHPPTSSCSTSACPTSTASRCAGGSAK